MSDPMSSESVLVMFGVCAREGQNVGAGRHTGTPRLVTCVQQGTKRHRENDQQKTNY